MKKEFETWAKSRHMPLRVSSTGDYWIETTQSAWEAWQTVYRRLSRAEELLRGVHTGDLFGPGDWDTVNIFLNVPSFPSLSEGGRVPVIEKRNEAE